MDQISYTYSNLIFTDRKFEVPLDYDNPDKHRITLFSREILRKENKHKDLILFGFLVILPIAIKE